MQAKLINAVPHKKQINSEKKKKGKGEQWAMTGKRISA